MSDTICYFENFQKLGLPISRKHGDVAPARRAIVRLKKAKISGVVESLVFELKSTRRHRIAVCLLRLGTGIGDRE